MGDFQEQIEEIQALEAIFDNKFTQEQPNSFTIEVTPNIKLFITFPPNYPSSAPPIFELLAPCLSSEQKLIIWEEFKEIFEIYAGTPVVYHCVEKLQQLAETCAEKEKPSMNEIKQSISPTILSYRFPVTHGDKITDRKSVFQGHAAIVESRDDVKAFLEYLEQNRKFANATHNISAFRVMEEKGLYSSCDDDGEKNAGARLAHLLQILDVNNVMVVVSRWYGGIHLGPDRFKHINNAARDALLQGGFIK